MIFYGAGGHAKVVIEAWVASGGKVTAVCDDSPKVKTLLGKNVYTGYDASANNDARLVVSIGFNRIRRDVVDKVKHRFGKIIHPSAIISPSATIDEGTVVMANTVVQAETKVGKHTIINTSASVDHDCVIGDFVHVAPGSVLCGNVTVSEGAIIGAGATVLPGITIGQWACVGAGSVVIADVPEFAVVVGNPTRVLRIDHPSLKLT